MTRAHPGDRVGLLSTLPTSDEWFDGAPCPLTACIHARFYNYSENLIIHVILDGRATSVLHRVERSGAGGMAGALGPAEERRAHMLAEADTDVRLRLAGMPHTHTELAREMFPPEPPCTSDRCASVVFVVDDGPLVVLVNLSTERVIGISGP